MRLSATATLLLIDLQRAIDDPSWGTRNNPEAEAQVARLLAAWRTSGRPVVHVRHVSRDPRSTYRPNQPGVDWKEGLGPVGNEAVVTKHVHSAFVGTPLEGMLRGLRVREVVIVGVITNNSVEATARTCADLGFATFVVADATFTFGRRDFAGVARTADEVHALSLANLDGEYATIVRTDPLLEALA